MVLWTAKWMEILKAKIVKPHKFLPGIMIEDGKKYLARVLVKQKFVGLQNGYMIVSREV